jgi:acetyl-CoA carboxylase biotin carboxyl carrier protein
MDIKDLKLLIKMITETDITEFELDNSEEKIVIRRGPKTEYINVGAPAQQIYSAPQQMAAPVASAVPGASVAMVAAETGETVNSPIVG